MKVKYPDDDYIIFDFETTGFNPEEDRVIEIAALWISGGEPRNSYEALVKVDKPIPEKITELTTITQELIDTQGKEELLAWQEFADFISGKPIIGHNILGFDIKFLVASFNRLSIPFNNLDSKKWIDTAAIYKAKKMQANPYWYENHFDFAKRVLDTKIFGLKFNLALCCEELGVDCSKFQAHRAIGDVFMVFEIYKKFLEGLQNG